MEVCSEQLHKQPSPSFDMKLARWLPTTVFTLANYSNGPLKSLLKFCASPNAIAANRGLTWQHSLSEFISNKVCLCISVSQFTVGFYGSLYDYVTHILRSHASLLTSIQPPPPKMVQLKRVGGLGTSREHHQSSSWLKFDLFTTNYWSQPLAKGCWNVVSPSQQNCTCGNVWNCGSVHGLYRVHHQQVKGYY